MRIDDRVEELVRDALQWVVKEDIDKLDVAFRKFHNEKMRKAALELLVSIIITSLIEALDHPPTTEEIDQLAVECVEENEWIHPTAEEIRLFLTAVFTPRALTDVLPPETIIVLAFVIAGSLLAAMPTEEGKWWFDHLDRVEMLIEMVPDQPAR